MPQWGEGMVEEGGGTYSTSLPTIPSPYLHLPPHLEVGRRHSGGEKAWWRREVEVGRRDSGGGGGEKGWWRREVGRRGGRGMHISKVRKPPSLAKLGSLHSMRKSKMEAYHRGLVPD